MAKLPPTLTMTITNIQSWVKPLAMAEAKNKKK